MAASELFGIKKLFMRDLTLELDASVFEGPSALLLLGLYDSWGSYRVRCGQCGWLASPRHIHAHGNAIILSSMCRVCINYE